MLKRVLSLVLLSIMVLFAFTSCGGDDITTTAVTTTTPSDGDTPSDPSTVTGKATSIKFSMFSDLHYKQGMYMSTIADVNAILNRANAANVDFILQAGDFCNDFMGSPELMKAYYNNSYSIPAYGVYGNHELETGGNTMAGVTPNITYDATKVIWGTEDKRIGDGSIAYYYYEVNGFRIICLDTNYSWNPTKNVWEHNLPASWGAPDGNSSYNALGPVQLKWLGEVLNEAADRNIPCVVVSHVGFADHWEASPDKAAVRALYDSVNAKNPGTVIASINGHLHTNRYETINGVVYLDINTVRNNFWHDDNTAHYTTETFMYENYDAYGDLIETKEMLLSDLSMAVKTYFAQDPLSAIITISADGTVTVEGQDSTWYGGLAPTKDPLPDGKMCKISSGTYQASGKTNTDITGTTVYPPAVEGNRLFDGQGTLGNPYLIQSAEDLIKLSEENQTNPFASTYFKLTADIDMAGKAWTPLKEFAGTFDGDGHIIANLTANVELLPHDGDKPHGGFADYFSGNLLNVAFSNLTYNGVANRVGKQVDGGMLFGQCFGHLKNIYMEGKANLTVGTNPEGSGNADIRFGTIAGYANNVYSSFTNVVTVTDIQGNCGIFRILGTNAALTVNNCYTVFKPDSVSAQRWTGADTFKVGNVTNYYSTGAKATDSVGGGATFAQMGTEGFYNSISDAVTVQNLYGDAMKLGTDWQTYADSAPLQKVFASNPNASALLNALK